MTVAGNANIAKWLMTVIGIGTVAYHILLPGPIAHDRFYVPVVPVVVALIACGGYNMGNEQVLPLHGIRGRGGHHD